MSILNINSDNDQRPEGEAKTNSDADKVQFLIYLLFAFGTGLTFYNNTWIWALGIGVPVLIVYLITKSFFLKYLEYITSLSLGLLSAQLAFQLPQYSLFTIIFFIAAGALVFYNNWKVYIPLFIVFLVHQILFYYLITLKTDPANAEMRKIETVIYLIVFIIQVLVGIIVLNRLKKVDLIKSELERKYKIQSMNLEYNINYAKEIASGNYDAINKSTSDDILGQSLREMSTNLRSAAEEDKNRNWAMAGIAKISEVIRISNHNMEELANELIGYLVKYLNATQGGIFVLNDSKKEDKFLELKGCYAYERKKYIGKRIELGQGLLGQAVVENGTIYLTEIPQNYLQITSGLGESNPSSIIIVPLKTEDNVVGALEIASFNKITDYQREFLEKVSENIASSIISSKNNDHTTRLLEESQVLAEQLSAQEEEMRQNMEELQATQEDLQRKNIEMEKAERQLTSTKDYLNSIINSIPNPVFVKDREHRFVVVNEAFCKFLKKNKDQILYKTDYELFEKEEAQAFWESDENVLKKFEVDVSEEDITESTGKHRTIIITKAPFKDSDDQIFIVASVIDITDRTVLERELSRERYLMEALMKGTTDNIYFKDLESKFIRVSNTMGVLFGAKDPSELVGKSDFDFFTREHALPAYEGEQEIIKTGVPLIDIVEKETWDDGRETYVSTTKLPLRDFDGKVVGTFGISRDVSNSKRTEAELVRKDKFYKLILKNSFEVNTIIEADGRIRYQTPSFYRIFGREEKDIVGQTLWDLVHPEDTTRLEKAINDAKKAQNNELLTTAFRYAKRNGTWVIMEAILQNYLEDEDIKAIIINSKESSQ